MIRTFFRGRKARSQDNEWVYGMPVEDEYYHNVEGCMITNVETSADDVDDVDFDYDFVDMRTVSQYTGVKDKDRKKIFEGDIVEYTDGEEKKRIFEVVYDEEYQRFCIWFDGLFSIGVNRHTSNEMKVIGNIYDNSELLEDKK